MSAGPTVAGRTDGLRSSSTLGTPAVQLDGVIVDQESRPFRETAGESVHAAIGELNHEATAVTDQVVSMGFIDASVVPVTMLHVDGPYQVQTRQEFHRAIDAGQADPGGDSAGPAMHLGHPEMVWSRS